MTAFAASNSQPSDREPESGHVLFIARIPGILAFTIDRRSLQRGGGWRVGSRDSNSQSFDLNPEVLPSELGW